MQTYQQIQYQVGEWNQANFGNQPTKYLHAKLHKSEVGDWPEVELGSTAALMGIVEEVGELFEASTPSETADAIGDIAIFLCDYCCREGIPFPTRVELQARDRLDYDVGLVVYMGRLHHCHLKRHQGIRGMEGTVFAEARMAALRAFVWHLEAAAKATGSNLVTILNQTWTNIVRKRDWKADPLNAGGVSNQAKT